jgi:Zn-dependent protease with chaperone function/Zn-finger nucleic acid-binding protein
MPTKRVPDFYEVQRTQWRKSLLVFAGLTLFYFLAVGLIAAAVILSLGLFAAGPDFLSGPHLVRLLLGVFAIALVVAVFHYLDARRFGAAYILKRLEAAPPEPSDRYHQQFANTVEEMRLAAGLPEVRAYVVPSFTINSLALLEADGTPAVAVTEGLLADCTRDEIQAVTAHELAHISRGDAFYVTLVCSLANFLERIQAALEPEETPAGVRASGAGGGGAPPVLVYLAVAFSSLVMRLLSMLLSREREVLADAAAAEIGRNPAALAGALYKAQLKSSFVGDFSLTYSPLFIVAPRLSSEEDGGLLGRVFNSHPPLMGRVRRLAAMAGLAPADVIERVTENRRLRAAARVMALSAAESERAVRESPVERQGDNLCPRCRLTLSDGFYEGVPVKSCPGCGGKLLSASHVGRVLSRREVDFSPGLLAAAARFREEFIDHPVKPRRRAKAALSHLTCPSCGYRLAARPYSYQYFIPLDKCLSCGQVWFDADELELLQILVEKKA